MNACDTILPVVALIFGLMLGHLIAAVIWWMADAIRDLMDEQGRTLVIWPMIALTYLIVMHNTINLLRNHGLILLEISAPIAPIWFRMYDCIAATKSFFISKIVICLQFGNNTQKFICVFEQAHKSNHNPKNCCVFWLCKKSVFVCKNNFLFSGSGI